MATYALKRNANKVFLSFNKTSSKWVIDRHIKTQHGEVPFDFLFYNYIFHERPDIFEEFLEWMCFPVYKMSADSKPQRSDDYSINDTSFLSTAMECGIFNYIYFLAFFFYTVRFSNFFNKYSDVLCHLKINLPKFLK